MRWLLLKDLQILRRSPFLVVVLVAYSAVIAVLVGVALSRGEDQPRVAFVNLVPPERNEFQIGGERLDASRYAGELFKTIEPVRVATRREAVAMVRAGEVDGALIVPADITRKLQAAINLSGAPARPTLEVIYNATNALEAEAVDARIRSRLADANRELAQRLTKIAAGYLDILLSGGSFSILGRDFNVLGLKRSKTLIDSVISTTPRGSPDRKALEQVAVFAQLAIDNLDLSGVVLGSVAAPLRVKQTSLNGRRTPLEPFFAAVALAVSLMFVAVLLAAGMLALEREENAYSRLVRGLVGRTALLAEKATLAALCALVVTLPMALGVSLFVELDRGRIALWALALACGGAGFGAMGVAIGVLAREVRAASLLAFLVTLPIAFLALVPASAVSTGLYDVVRAVSSAFPFKPALEALDGALNGAGDPGLGRSIAHLGALCVAYLGLARVAMRRLG